MSTKDCTRALGTADLDKKLMPTSKPSDTSRIARTQPREPLDRVESIIGSPENMAIFDAPPDSDDDTAQGAPPVVSDFAACLANQADVLSELYRMTLAHADMLTNLQAATHALFDQVASATARVDELEAEIVNIQWNKSLARNAFAAPPSPPYRFPGPSVHTGPWRVSLAGHLVYQDHDMSDIAATLAAAPRDLSSISSRSSSSSSARSYKERRHARPHREEHVKRSRITYDRKGGQTPDIPPTAVSFTARKNTQQRTCSPNDTAHNDATSSEVQKHAEADKANCLPANTNKSPQSAGRAASSLKSKKHTENTIADETNEPSLASWLLEKASKALFGE